MNTLLLNLRRGLRAFGGWLRLTALRFAVRFRRPPLDAKTRLELAACKKILIVRGEGIGDNLLMLPALRVLRQHLPQAQIDVLVRPWNAFLYDEPGLIDTVFIFERGARSRTRGQKPYSVGALLRRLRRQRYDVAISIEKDDVTRRLAFYSGARMCCCRACQDDPYGFLVSHHVTLPEWELRPLLSPVHLCLAFMEALGIKASSIPYGYSPPDPCAAAIDQCLKSLGVRRAIAIIHPCGSNPNKNWAPDRFAAVADYLVAHYNLDVLVTGTEADKNEVRRIMVHVSASGRVYDVSGKFTMPEMAALYARASLMVTVDTGPMHVADAVGTPLVALFLPWNGRFRPFRQPEAALMPLDEKGQPLMTSMPHDAESVQYLLHIPISQVLAAVDHSLEKRPSPAGTL